MVAVRCTAQAAATADKAKLFEELKESCAAFKKAPPSMVSDVRNRMYDVMRLLGTAAACEELPAHHHK